MRKILKEDKILINDEKYILRTVDLSETPLGGLEYPYEQLLYPLFEDEIYNGRLLNRSETEEEALISHERQLDSIKRNNIILDFL